MTGSKTFFEALTAYEDLYGSATFVNAAGTFFVHVFKSCVCACQTCVLLGLAWLYWSMVTMA